MSSLKYTQPVALSSVKYLLIFIPVFITCLLVNREIYGPVYQGDEGAYLTKALALSGNQIDAASRWHAGYSIFLLPAVFLGNDPISIFTYVKITNSLLTAISAVVIYVWLSTI